MSRKEAVVLAGGFGTRLQPVVADLPKPMADVCGRPFLTYVLDELCAYRFTHVVLSTGYKHECIEQYFGGSYRSLKVSYAPETTPLGTGGGIWNAMRQTVSENVCVLNGDTLFRVDLDALQAFGSSRDALLTMALRQVEDTSRYGRVEKGEDGRILDFVEKNKASGPGFINGGVYWLSPALFAGRQAGEAFSFEKEVLEAQYRFQAFYAQPSDAYFIDIGIPEDYARAQKELHSF